MFVTHPLGEDLQQNTQEFTTQLARMQKTLTTKWPFVFRNRLLPLFDEEVFRPLCENRPDPNPPYNLMMGVLLLSPLTRLTPNEICIHLEERSPDFLYALNLMGEEQIPFRMSDITQFLGDCFAYQQNSPDHKDLLDQCFEDFFTKVQAIADEDATFAGVFSSIACSCIGYYSPLHLIYLNNAVLVRLLKERGTAIPDSLQHYLKQDDLPILLHGSLKSHEEICESLVNDITALNTLHKASDPETRKLFSTFLRVVKDTCEVNLDGRIAIKEKNLDPYDYFYNAPNNLRTIILKKTGNPALQFMGGVRDIAGSWGKLTLQFLALRAEEPVSSMVAEYLYQLHYPDEAPEGYGGKDTASYCMGYFIPESTMAEQTPHDRALLVWRLRNKHSLALY